SGVPVEQGGVYLSSLDGKENRRILADQSSAVLAGGRLLFSRENTLMAQPFDEPNGQIVGEAVPVAASVVFTTVNSYAAITVSETGDLMYQSGVGNNQMLWYDRGGNVLETVGAPGPVGEPAIGPDEKSIVFRRTAGETADLWLRDLARGVEQRFTTLANPQRTALINAAPLWSPRGDHIAFSSNRDGGIVNLYQKQTNGTGEDEKLLTIGQSILATQWSRDGRFIVFQTQDPKTKGDIWILPMDSGA